jgi:hypothetical protein
MGRNIQKDELIQLHAFLLQLRTNLENMIVKNDPDIFLSYDSLNTGPHKIHKSKTDHKIAIFELSKGIALLLKNDNSKLFDKVHDDLERLCEFFKNEL